MKEKDIHTLVARFFDGETTLEEEEKLYAFFQRKDVPEDLKKYQDLFRGFAFISPKQADEKQSAKRMPLWVRVTSMAAACLLAVSLIGYTLYRGNVDAPKEMIGVKEGSNDTMYTPTHNVVPASELVAEMKPEIKKNVERKQTEPEEPMPIAPSASVAPNVPTTSFSSTVVMTHVPEPKAIYASNEASDSTYQEPSRMDDFIEKFARYNQVEPVALECALKGDSTMMSVAYVFPDKKELDVFGRLLQAACWYDDATPGYHLNFSHLQFFFELKDERKGLKYLWIADRINGKILLYSTHSPIGTTVSSECYQRLRDGLMHANNKVKYQL